MDKRFDISEVATMYRISTRTLRYYEEAGLLTSHRKADSRYREYDRGQCERLEVILLLRRLSFGVKEISELLHGDEAWFHALLKEKIAASERHLLEAKETNRLLQDIMKELSSKPVSELKVDELLSRYTYLTNKTERMIPVNANQEDKYLILIGYGLVPMVGEEAKPENLLGKIAALREALSKDSIQLPRIRVRDEMDLNPDEAIVIWEGKEIWRKRHQSDEVAFYEKFADEVVRQIRQHMK